MDTALIASAKERYGGRKFWLVVLVFLCSTGLLLTSHLPKEVFQDLVQMIILVYLAGNVTQKLVTPITEMDTSNEELSLIDIAGGRKFALVVLIYVTFAVLLFFSRIDQTVYSNVSNWIVAGYVSGNVIQKLTTSGLTLAGVSFGVVKQ